MYKRHMLEIKHFKDNNYKFNKSKSQKHMCINQMEGNTNIH